MSQIQSVPMSTPNPEPIRPQKTPASDHLSVRVGGPPEVHFLFEQQEKRLGGALGASVLSHVAFIALAFLVLRLVPDSVAQAVLPDSLPRQIVWLAEPGAGGGGGGGGNQMKEPPRKAELPGEKEISVPAIKPLPPTEVPKEEIPQPDTNIPAKTLGADQLVMPGVLESESTSVSQGVGTGGGGGTGSGTGIGSGEGSGLGTGFGGGTGGGAYRPGNGVLLPKVLREVKPQYTADAMRAKVQGTVLLECVVNPDGTVGSVDVVKSLDRTFGLDQEAIKAAKQWRFAPGTRFGEPVAVLVTIELTFTLR
jgi:periplasmic protein TonB